MLINNELVQVLEFVLVAMLGFMPLTVIHWADRRPPLRLPLPGNLGGHYVAARAALITLVSVFAVLMAL